MEARVRSEEWRTIAECYEISNLGRVRSTNYHNKAKTRVLKIRRVKGGYEKVDLKIDGVKKPYLVHRLVAKAFVPNPCPEKYDVVNHKDENPSNNTVDNLEWCTQEYNINYGTANERRAKTLTNRKISKTVYQYNKDTHEFIKEWQSTREIQRQTGWSQSNISKCCRGKKESAYGFLWTYTNEPPIYKKKDRKNNANSKVVYQYEKDGRTLVKEYPSANEVERQTGWAQSIISRCCRGKLKLYKGYKWTYERLTA